MAPRPPQVTRRVLPGRCRSTGEGAVLDCLLLAPGPEWVALDVASGALVRGSLGRAPADLAPALFGAPLSSIRLVLAEAREPWDPSRPEAVEFTTVTESASPSRRKVRGLLAGIATSSGEPLLGSPGPSQAYVELAGTRPSVVVVRPDGGRVRLVGRQSLIAYFHLGERAYSLPLSEGVARWVVSGHVSTTASRPRSARRTSAPGPGPGIEPTTPVLVVAGLDRPEGGQVRKVVLGLIA